MANSVAFLTLHGMGDTPSNYSSELRRDLRKKMKKDFEQEVTFQEVYYQHILQQNENLVWERLANQLRWDLLRKFLLFGFADAAGLEHRKELAGSSYIKAQLEIANCLYRAKQNLDPAAKVVLLARSLGCQVLSCYLWDAGEQRQNRPVHVGIWKDIQQYIPQITSLSKRDYSQDLPADGKGQLSVEELEFIRGDQIHTLYTTGCNIPIFVAAHKSADIVPFAKPNPDFRWLNYYDKDDVLGWPLADLSEKYREAVTDIKVNAGSGIFGWITKSWNPMSHGEYWDDSDVLRPLEELLDNLA